MRIQNFIALFLFCLGLLVSKLSNAQENSDSSHINDYSVSRKMADSLLKNGADTIIRIYISSEWSIYEQSEYLFWSENSKYYGRQLEFINSIAKISSVNVPKNIFSFLSVNYAIIDREEILPFVEKRNSNNAVGYSPIIGTHPQYAYIAVYTKDHNLQQNILLRGLSEISDLDDKITNVNYQFNISTKLYTFYMMLKDLIKNR